MMSLIRSLLKSIRTKKAFFWLACLLMVYIIMNQLFLFSIDSTQSDKDDPNQIEHDSNQLVISAITENF